MNDFHGWAFFPAGDGKLQGLTYPLPPRECHLTKGLTRISAADEAAYPKAFAEARAYPNKVMIVD